MRQNMCLLFVVGALMMAAASATPTFHMQYSVFHVNNEPGCCEFEITRLSNVRDLARRHCHPSGVDGVSQKYRSFGLHGADDQMQHRRLGVMTFSVTRNQTWVAEALKNAPSSEQETLSRCFAVDEVVISAQSIDGLVPAIKAKQAEIGFEWQRIRDLLFQPFYATDEVSTRPRLAAYFHFAAEDEVAEFLTIGRGAVFNVATATQLASAVPVVLGFEFDATAEAVTMCRSHRSCNHTNEAQVATVAVALKKYASVTEPPQFAAFFTFIDASEIVLLDILAGEAVEESVVRILKYMCQAAAVWKAISFVCMRHLASDLVIWMQRRLDETRQLPFDPYSAEIFYSPQPNGPLKAALDIGHRYEPFIDEFLIDFQWYFVRHLTKPVLKDPPVLTQLWPGSEGVLRYTSSFQLPATRETEALEVMHYMVGVEQRDVFVEKAPTWSNLSIRDTLLEHYYPWFRLALVYGTMNDDQTYTRPVLEHVPGFEGTNTVFHDKRNEFHFVSFYDTNPAAHPDERIKAMMGEEEVTIPGFDGLYALASPDGVQWHDMNGDRSPVFTSAQIRAPSFKDVYFDSQPSVFWDTVSKRYILLTRCNPAQGLRTIQVSYSDDFQTWSNPVESRLHFKGGDLGTEEMFYKASAFPLPGAEHIIVALPTRMIEVTRSSTVTMISSRDGGVTWNRVNGFLSWDLPRATRGLGPSQGHDWHTFEIGVGMGENCIVQKNGDVDLFVHYNMFHYDSTVCRARVPQGSFSFLRADGTGVMTTRRLVVSGSVLNLHLAAPFEGGPQSSVQIEVVDPESEQPLPGFSFRDFDPMIVSGSVIKPYRALWKNGANLSELSQSIVILAIIGIRVDVHGLQFTDG